jgi:hypothetical protein
MQKARRRELRKILQILAQKRRKNRRNGLKPEKRISLVRLKLNKHSGKGN